MLTLIVIASFLAFSCASISVYWYEILQEGMIFEKIGVLLKDKWYGKPLGVCPTCFNTWLSIGVYGGVYGFVSVYSVLGVFLFVGLSNTFLRKI